jgi:hypothetical protein
MFLFSLLNPRYLLDVLVVLLRKTTLITMILSLLSLVPVVPVGHVNGAAADEQHDHYRDPLPLVLGVHVGCAVYAARKTMLNIMIISLLC